MREPRSSRDPHFWDSLARLVCHPPIFAFLLMFHGFVSCVMLLHDYRLYWAVLLLGLITPCDYLIRIRGYVRETRAGSHLVAGSYLRPVQNRWFFQILKIMLLTAGFMVFSIRLYLDGVFPRSIMVATSYAFNSGFMPLGYLLILDRCYQRYREGG